MQVAGSQAVLLVLLFDVWMLFGIVNPLMDVDLRADYVVARDPIGADVAAESCGEAGADVPRRFDSVGQAIEGQAFERGFVASGLYEGKLHGGKSLDEAHNVVLVLPLLREQEFQILHAQSLATDHGAKLAADVVACEVVVEDCLQAPERAAGVRVAEAREKRPHRHLQAAFEGGYGVVAC